MAFIKKMLYWLLVFVSIFFAFDNISYAQCSSQEIELNTSVPWYENRCLKPDEATDKFGGIMWGMMKVFINITVAVAFLMLIASGVMITMWGADQWMASKWKELFKKVLIGILLIWLSWLILNTINPNFWTV